MTTYWSRFEQYYFAGDGAKLDEDGDIWVLGRVDDVINVAGHRISTAEVESALVEHHDVAEAAVVGVPDAVKGEAVVAFVVVRAGGAPHENGELEADLRELVARQIGKFARPQQILVVPELPKTRSGKIMRRLLRDALQHRGLGDVTTLADSGVMEVIAAEIAGAAGVGSGEPRH